jgi:hypothetical protein
MQQQDLFSPSNDTQNVMANSQERQSKMKNKPQLDVNLNIVQRKALSDAIVRLKAANCSFKIVLPNGEEISHDPDNRLSPKRKSKNMRCGGVYNRGDLKRHYLPYISNLVPGSIAEIPYTNELPYQAIQSSLSAHLSTEWGIGSYTTATNKKTKMIELLRLA